MYTTSSLFLKSLSSLGIKVLYANFGSDHPAILEELARLRKEGDSGLRLVTAPNEMVALSAAQGYAQITGEPSAVFVHVDVGTQALGGAIHNVDRSRCPVIIYAGASPFSSGTDIKGGRNEWIMWLQDIPDQAAIVRQYMRFSSQMHSYKMVPQITKRAIQIATSEPRGPVYLWARREVMEEEIPLSQTEALFDHLSVACPPVEPTALTPDAIRKISTALLSAKAPLIVTSHLGRNPKAVVLLSQMCSILAVPVLCVTPSVVNIPFSRPEFAGVSYLQPGAHYDELQDCDVILVIDSSLPWIDNNAKPCAAAKVFIVDTGDPLNVSIGFWHGEADLICRADPAVALTQIIEVISRCELDKSAINARSLKLASKHQAMTSDLDAQEAFFPERVQGSRSSITVPNLIGALRKTIAAETNGRVIYLNETISNYGAVWMHLRAERDVFTSGGSSLGWSLGAAVGVGTSGEPHDLVVVIVGDGSFLFGVPSSAFWMARKYNTPFLTVVLNNGGWKSPKLSMAAIYPDGHGSKASASLDLGVGFGPHCPDYSAIGTAATDGWAWGLRIGTGDRDGKNALEEALDEAVKVVLHEKRCAILDCVLDSV